MRTGARTWRRTGAANDALGRRVTYNGENRPILWQCLESNNQAISNQTIITMSYDRMGRRVTKNNQRFVYDGYLQVANFHSTTTTPNYDYFIWDPTEPIATRPLVWQRGTSVAYYTHDGNKNVSEVIASNSDVTAHYEYAPFGAVVIRRGALAVANPWRFSSEYDDDELGCDYYNYREYEPVAGRWMCRDPIEEKGGENPFAFIACSVGLIDYLGLVKGGDDGNKHPGAEYKMGSSTYPYSFVLDISPQNIQNGCELNVIQMVRGFEGGKSTGWEVDNRRRPGVPDPLGAFYYNFADEKQSVYRNADGSIVFFDQPSDLAEFYLIIVQRCCLEYYGDSKQCECCKKSKATVLEVVHWVTVSDDKMEYIPPKLILGG